VPVPSVDIGSPGQTFLTLKDAVRTTYGSIEFVAEIHAETLRASVRGELQSWSGAGASLVHFMDALARDWRGWAGQREWREDSGSLSILVDHDGKGTVRFLVSLESFGETSITESWTATAGFEVELGRLEDLADAIRAFVSEAGTPEPT
jgi:hypothetical protein